MHPYFQALVAQWTKQQISNLSVASSTLAGGTMASGKAHTKATIILAILSTPLFAFPGYQLIPIGISLGLWLSPDLDTKSDPYNRWGIIKFIWWPYQRIFSHRSPWTHLPIISTIIRVIYLSPFIYLSTMLSGHCPDTHYIQIILGIMLSDILHAIMDI